jgi:anion-transporting  ArsA/GET3 family ATPase
LLLAMRGQKPYKARLTMASLAPLLRERRILVCVGSGGVGKTTTAATLGLGAAQLGRRTLVLTIDPARRLANALGLEGLSHDVREVPRARLEAAGLELPEGGALFAMMLDQKRAFDELVVRHAKDAATRDRIFANPIYKQMSSSLAGSHEYAAMSKLYEIHAEGGYDLIVLDTPPTANALDFLDAPQRLTGAIDSPAVEWLTKPYVEAGRFSVKALGMGAAFVLGRLAKFVGSDFLDDMARFFVEFNQILGGFRERAQKVYEVLRGPEAAFVLVSSAEPLSVDEAMYFEDRLRSASMPLGGFVVNRVHPRRPPLTVDGKPLDRAALVSRLEGRAELQGFAPDDLVQFAADLERTHKELDALAVLDDLQIARLRVRAGDAPIVTVPLFQHDVYDVPALVELLGHLAG